MKKSGRIRAGVFRAGICLNLLLLCSCATTPSARRSLPADVPINQDAGRGNWLVVNIQLENGQKLPFVLDTGAGGTLLNKSLAPKLGKCLGTTILSHWGLTSTNDVYASPRLYLGGAPLLMTGDDVICGDLKDMMGGTGRKFMGILGMDVLEHYCLQLDFAAGKIRFLDDPHADKSTWGKAFPIVTLNDEDGRPAVAENLLGRPDPDSIIDTGFLGDGWLRPEDFQAWTNDAVAPAKGELRWPDGRFGGENYPMFSLGAQNVESDGIGIDFLARHLVTLDFPNHTLYLKRLSIGLRPVPNVRLAEYQPIPDREPQVTAHLRAMVQDLMAGSPHADDYTGSCWRKLLARQKDIQRFTKYAGNMVAVSLVERSSFLGWRRSYRYQIEFTKATALAHFVFHGRNKVAAGTLATVAWKDPAD